jgi:hypothetical protein
MTDKDKLSHFRCYWTRPFGHIWREGQTSYNRTCVLCEKESTKGDYDGGWHYDLDVHYGWLVPSQRDIELSERDQARARRALEKKKKRLNILEELFK